MSQHVKRVSLKHSFYWFSSARPCDKRFCPKNTPGSLRNITTDKATASNRRRSLTLATTWGHPYVSHYTSRITEKWCIRKVHISAKKERTALEFHGKGRFDKKIFESQVKNEIGRENLTTVSAAQFQSTASRCPFHLLFTGKNEKANSRKLNFLSQRREQSVASNLGDLSVVGKMPNTIGKMIKEFNTIKKKVTTDVTRMYDQLLPTKAMAANSSTKPYSEIPGPRPLPFLGSVLDYSFLGPFSPRKFHEAFVARHEKYGTIFRERFLSEEFVYISEPKDVAILAHNEGRTPCRPHIEAMVESRKQEGYPIGISAMQGDEWKRHRSALNTAIMKPNAMKAYRTAQNEVANDLVTYIRENRNAVNGEVKDFEVWLSRWALESVAVVLLDTRLGLIHSKVKKSNPIAERLRKGMDVFFDYGARLTFSAPTWKIWQTRDWKIFRQAQRDEFEAAGYYVDRKIQEIENLSSNPNFTNDPKKTNTQARFLKHVLFDSNLERDESLTLCLELLAGGIDTTSNAVTFILYEMAKNPTCQEELRNLISKEKGQEEKETKTSRYIRGCVMEALRLHPLTFVNMRRTEKDMILSGYQIPAGTTVRFTQHLIHLRNEKYFPKPDSFIPERWLTNNSPLRCKEQFVFLPFGHGARQCPGRRIAEQELDLLLRAIFTNFKVEYNHEDMGTQVRLFNCADKPAKFSFINLQETGK